MNQLAICDLYHPLKYGYTAASSRTITGQFLVYTLLDVEDFFDEHGIVEALEDILWRLQCNFGELSHPLIRNYNHYILCKKYNNVEIVESYELRNGELVAILKTFWISIIQRRWRHIFNERKRVLNIRKMPTSILYREIHGKWPKHCLTWPIFTLNIP